MTSLSQARLQRDLNRVSAQVQDLMERLNDEGGERLQSLRDRASGVAQVLGAKARDTFTDLNSSVRDNAMTAARATDQMVRDNPWRAIGVGAAVGLLLGYLVSRR
jgi:ElaB/YqjD/DUF883 family membrane-anchored ribosome-binding protein